MALPCHGQSLYSFGNPTAAEQQYIEYINRARAAPAAEGVLLANTTDSDVTGAYTYFGVDLNMMQSEFAALSPQPPVAPSAGLTTAARNHSAWMLATATQSHNETNPSNTPGSRITAAGYNWSTYGENIYAYVKSAWHGHAGFEVDWGTGGTGGMQSGRGHRASIHNSAFREIGVGVVFGTNGPVGPEIVTQDFGSQSGSTYYGTGVAYYDLNSNNFYDIGEGIAGLRVDVNGASYYCTTAIGGGWVVPVVSTAATRAVTFSGLNINQSTNLVFPGSKNAKLDLKLTYSPPTITSSASGTSGIQHALNFNAVGGATAYKWNRWNLATAVAENCESTSNITTSTTGTYSVLNTNVKQQGASSFHLENTTGSNQSLELNSLYYGQVSPTISFQSRVRYATTDEKFKVQIKEEGSTAWQDVYSQTGTDTSGEGSFSLRSAALTGFSGKAFRVRFLLSSSGYYYTSSGDNVGWFIDAINFSGVSTLNGNVSQTLAGNSASFIPTAGSYLMSVSPVISNRDFPAAYQVLTVADPATFAAWSSSIESSNSLPAGSISNASGDYDKDGMKNLVEYAFFMDPKLTNSPAGLPQVTRNGNNLEISYTPPSGRADVIYGAEWSENLADWFSISNSGSGGAKKFSVSTTGKPKLFMRHRIALQP